MSFVIKCSNQRVGQSSCPSPTPASVASRSRSNAGFVQRLDEIIECLFSDLGIRHLPTKALEVFVFVDRADGNLIAAQRRKHATQFARCTDQVRAAAPPAATHLTPFKFYLSMCS